MSENNREAGVKTGGVEGLDAERHLRIALNIKRYDPDRGKSWFQRYELEAGRILRFTDVFRKINNEQDPTLAWNSSCEHAQCGTCGVRVNGKPLLACELLVGNAVERFGATEFKIEPLSVAPVIRDLIVDFERAYERVHAVKPFVIEPGPAPPEGGEHVIAPRLLDRFVDATRCINCFCCASACISSHTNFLGPNALLASIVRLMDPREGEKEQRWRALCGQNGISRCHTSRACSHVCPKEIDVAHFIALAKSGVLF